MSGSNCCFFICKQISQEAGKVVWYSHLLENFPKFVISDQHSDPHSQMLQFSQFSYSVVSNSLWPHGLQHTRLPCPSPSPRVCSDSCLLSHWCHLTISSSVIPFSSCPQSSGSFPVSQLFTSGGQSIGVSVSASVLPINIQGWFPLGLTSLLS